MGEGSADGAIEIPAMKEPRIEEIRGLTAGFQSVISEGDDVASDAAFYEVGFVGWRVGGCGGGSDGGGGAGGKAGHRGDTGEDFLWVFLRIMVKMKEIFSYLKRNLYIEIK